MDCERACSKVPPAQHSRPDTYWQSWTCSGGHIYLLIAENVDNFIHQHQQSCPLDQLRAYSIVAPANTTLQSIHCVQQLHVAGRQAAGMPIQPGIVYYSNGRNESYWVCSIQTCTSEKQSPIVYGVGGVCLWCTNFISGRIVNIISRLVDTYILRNSSSISSVMGRMEQV